MILPRYHRHTEAAQDAAKLATILLETGEPLPLRVTATAGGDERRLRGIPVVGARGVGGAIPGTRPTDCLR